MRTILFISFLLLLWCGFSSFESTSVRPNGWYYVISEYWTTLIKRLGLKRRKSQ